MTVGIFVDTQGFVDVLRSIEREDAAQRQDASVNGVEFCHAPYGKVDVKLLRHPGLGPRRASEYVDLLKGERRCSIGPEQVDPVATRGIVRAGFRRFVTAPVEETEELTPELGTRARIRRVEDDLD